MFKETTIIITFCILVVGVGLIGVIDKLTRNTISEKTHVFDIDMRIVMFSADIGKQFNRADKCNVILLETLDSPRLYREINTCDPHKFKIDRKWIYTHHEGDTVHFDYLRKDYFFTID